MYSVVLKNDAVGDLCHSLEAIDNITSSSTKVTIFLSKRGQNYSFLINNSNPEIKILNYNLNLIEKVKLIFFLLINRVDNVYILTPKNFYYYLPLIFRNIKFYAICVDNIDNYKRPGLFLRKFLFKCEINDRGKIFKRESIKSIQNRLTIYDKKLSNYLFNVNIKKSESLNNILPDKYIFFHFKKKIFSELNWGPDELHCKIEKWEDYRSYRNSFYEFKPKYRGYDFIVPSKNIKKTISKMRFFLKKGI